PSRSSSPTARSGASREGSDGTVIHPAPPRIDPIVPVCQPWAGILPAAQSVASAGPYALISTTLLAQVLTFSCETFSPQRITVLRLGTCSGWRTLMADGVNAAQLT